METIKNKINWLFRFIEFNNQIGEELIGPIKVDVVLNVFEQQGYWSGVKHNIFYENGRFYAQMRAFGTNV